MMLDVTVALFGILLVTWIIRRWKYTSMFSDLGIPGPKPNVFFGNMLELYKKGPIRCHEEWVAKYGRIVGFYYGMKRTLLVADPEMLKNIYIKDFSKFVDREPFHPLFSNDEKDEPEPNVINAKGHKWKDTRSVLTPTFSTAKMKRMAVTMNESVNVMISVMRGKAKTGEVFNIHDSYQRLTMDIIAKTAFGVILDIQTNSKSRFLRAAKVMFSTPYYSILTFIGLSFPYLRRLAFFCQRVIGRFLNLGSSPYETLRVGVTEVIAHRRTNPESRKVDILQLMIDAKLTTDGNKVDEKKLEAGGVADEGEVAAVGEGNKTTAIRNMSDREIIASAVVVFLAGYETTSTALAFTSYLLAKHSEIQEKVYEEIKELVSDGFELEYATINKLPYLDKVLCESMRVYPPVYLFTNRIAVEDVQYGPLKIPKDTIIQAPCYLLHHDPDYWPDPEVFDPERFNTRPNSDGITYFPFGIGPRNCLGMRFAQMEAKLALAHTIYNFRLQLDEKLKDNFPLSLRIRTISPTFGVNVRLEVRDKND